jgi:signal transduction histidine kinase
MSTAVTTELPTAQEHPRRAHALADAAGRLTLAAGALLVGGLAAALGGSGDATPALALAGAGTVLALFVLVPRAGRGLLLAGALLAVAPIVLYGMFVIGATPAVVALLPVAVVLTAAAVGLILLGDDLRRRVDRRMRTPWQRLSGTRVEGAQGPWRGLAGVALVAFAALLGIAYLSAIGGVAFGDLLALLLVGGAGLALICVPLGVAWFVRADRNRVRAAREDERQHVAAHLHDSVLQTLALVQRQAHDPAAVARLARRQEHDLRAWMAGETALGAETLASALRDAVAEVEDEHRIQVEVSVLGDRPLDRPAEALAAAAREALRNAARHAAGAPVFVFAQLARDGAEVFVRDDGPGFVLAEVPTERRGVRDAIVGRMAAVSGSATVESAPGEGTEVALRI